MPDNPLDHILTTAKIAALRESVRTTVWKDADLKMTVNELCRQLITAREALEAYQPQAEPDGNRYVVGIVDDIQDDDPQFDNQVSAINEAKIRSWDDNVYGIWGENNESLDFLVYNREVFRRVETDH